MQTQVATIYKQEFITSPLSRLGAVRSYSIEDLINQFADYAIYDLTLRPETVAKYKETLHWLLRYLPHIKSPEQLHITDITELKKQMMQKELSSCRVNSVVFALRKFLTYCSDVHKLVTMSPKEIKPMKIANRQVVFLTAEELKQFFGSMNTKDVRGLRMRALSEVLYATGMRISEALSLDQCGIDWQAKEAKVIGKGNKQRDIFFNDRAIMWLQKYLSKRKDKNPALFVTFGTATRLTRFDLSKQFRHYAEKTGLKKKITPHILRHTMATTIMRNGGDIRFIQELLGHSSIETTAKYYLGTDKRMLKEAHSKFLKID